MPRPSRFDLVALPPRREGCYSLDIVQGGISIQRACESPDLERVMDAFRSLGQQMCYHDVVLFSPDGSQKVLVYGKTYSD